MKAIRIGRDFKDGSQIILSFLLIAVSCVSLRAFVLIEPTVWISQPALIAGSDAAE